MNKTTFLPVGKRHNSAMLFWAAWLLVGGLSAQNPNITNGHYISAQGDSLVGQINISKINDNVLLFKALGEKHWKKLSAQEVREAAGDRGLHIISHEVRLADTTEQILLQKMVAGRFNLYEGDSKKWGTVFFIHSTGAKGLTKVNKLGFKPQLEVLLGDCSRQTKVKNIQYSSNSLARYLTQVNQCVQPDSPAFVFRQPIIKPRFGIGLNTFFYTINPEVRDGDYFLGDYHRVNRWSAGVFARLKISPALSVFAGLSFVNKRIGTDTLMRKFFYVKEVPGQFPSYTYDYYKYAMDLNFRYLEIPLGMTYSPLQHARWSPIFSFGFALLRPTVVKVNDWGYPVCITFGGCSLPPDEASHISPTWVEISKRNLVNFFGGVGLRKILNRNQEVEVRLEYFNQRERAVVGINKLQPNSQDIILKTARLQVSLNYHFFFKNKP